MKSRSLRSRLLFVAFAAGVFISVILLALEYLDFRRSAALISTQAEQSLLATQGHVLQIRAEQAWIVNATRMEAALKSRAPRALDDALAAALTDPDVLAIRLTRDDQPIREVRREGRSPADQEMRTVRRTLPNAPEHVLELTAGEAGMLASAAAVRAKVNAASREELWRGLRMVAIASLLITAVLMLLAWLFAHRLGRPLAQLVRSAERIGEGDYSPPQPVSSDDEILELERALDRMRQRLRQTTITTNYLSTVLNSMNDAVLVTAPTGEVQRINEAAVRLFGYREEELAGRSIVELLAENERAEFSLERAGVETRETVITTSAGQTIPVSISGAPLAGEDSQFQGTIFVVRNITDRKRAERRIRYLARYDALTKVPNRMQFQHMLQQAIARARRSDRSIVLLYLDMDRFKEINDTFGHAAGDRTLEVLSERLTRTLPREAVIGRLAGDEFGLFIEGFAEPNEERAQAANLARLVLSEVCKAYYVEQQEVYLSASIGVAFCPQDAENVIDLIRNADAAMYHSKQNGGNNFAFYSPEMNAAAVERLMLKSKLRRALDRDELRMFYQPKVDLHDGRIIGAEALLRWRLPGHGDIPPSQFIPLAEETTLILGIGEWVLNRVCSDYREWTQRVKNPGRVSINLSLKQLRQASFITRFQSVFRKHGVSPTCFELEITETTLMADPKRTIKMLDELYAMGLHLSIDDFGTGYSSLSALQQFPIGTLKIDQSFVRDAAINSDDATIVRTIIDMGKALEVEVVAEGVETEEQLEFLRNRGCHYGQGRLFGDAMSAEEFLMLLTAQESGRAKVSELFARKISAN